MCINSSTFFSWKGKKKKKLKKEGKSNIEINVYMQLYNERWRRQWIKINEMNGLYVMYTKIVFLASNMLKINLWYGMRSERTKS